MADADKDLDKVISYVVHRDVDPKSFEQLEVALNKGYRVVDVLSTPTNVGGAGANYGPVVVTVVLSKAPGSTYHPKSKG